MIRRQTLGNFRTKRRRSQHTLGNGHHFPALRRRPLGNFRTKRRRSKHTIGDGHRFPVLRRRPLGNFRTKRRRSKNTIGDGHHFPQRRFDFQARLCSTTFAAECQQIGKFITQARFKTIDFTPTVRSPSRCRPEAANRSVRC